MTCRRPAMIRKWTGEVVETMASLVQTFTAGEIEPFVEEKTLPQSVLIEELDKSRLEKILQ
jgi:hypothetical protein